MNEMTIAKIWFISLGDSACNYIWRIQLQLENPETHLLKFTAANQFLITHTYVIASIIILKYP